MAVVRKLVLSKTFIKAYQKLSGKNRSVQSSIDNTMLKLEQDIYDPALRRINLAENWPYIWPALAVMIAGSSSPLKNIRIKPNVSC